MGDADHERFKNVLDVVLAHPNIGSVVTMCTPSSTLDYNKLAEVIVAMSKKYGKTTLATLMGQDEILADGNIPYYDYAERSDVNATVFFEEGKGCKAVDGRIGLS